MKYYHDQHIGVYENAISDEWCDDVIKYFESNVENSYKRKLNRKIRDTSVNLDNKLLTNKFSNIFKEIFDLYLYKYPFSPVPLAITGFKIQKTLPTEGFHQFHIERDTSFSTKARELVYTVYLNDVEEGGETEFLHQLKRIKPQKGTICIFPAGFTHVHRGNTPYSGEKYILTGWLEYPKEENIGS